MAKPDFMAAFIDWTLAHAGTHPAWLAEVDGAPAGMAWLAIVDRVPGRRLWSRISGNLQSVFVLPEHRNGGLGEQLVGAALEHARAQGMEYVSVHPSERSFPLYRRAGFAESPGVLELRWAPWLTGRSEDRS
jgi:GNAT superfamily N-acetyltransferase